MTRVWPGLFVEENNIQVHISALRKALDQGKSGENYLVTVPGRGYRLIGLRSPNALAHSDSAPGPALPDKPSIVVLPFKNMSGDPEQEYFADGMVDEIIAALSLAFVVGEFDDGAAFMDQALALNPNLARAWHLSGWVRIWLSKPGLAIEHLARAMRLSPRDPNLFDMQTATACAHLYCGRYNEALTWAEAAFREQPNWAAAMRVLAASSALTGDVDKAQKVMAKLQLIDAGRRIGNLVEVLASYRPKDFATLADGLRKAGMSE